MSGHVGRTEEMTDARTARSPKGSPVAVVTAQSSSLKHKHNPTLPFPVHNHTKTREPLLPS